jgi:hypothetical protein
MNEISFLFDGTCLKIATLATELWSYSARLDHAEGSFALTLNAQVVVENLLRGESSSQH